VSKVPVALQLCFGTVQSDCGGVSGLDSCKPGTSISLHQYSQAHRNSGHTRRTSLARGLLYRPLLSTLAKRSSRLVRGTRT
jgi:hypothetical protein